MSLAGFLVAYLFRWLPHRTATGLRACGNPGPDSPVFVTGNFSLTVKRLIKGLKGIDAWVLAANSDGINVWCASAGGILTENRVIDAIKVSGLADKVSRREVILPPLAAPGIERRAIRPETGFRAIWGPVDAADIPAYLEAGKKRSEEMKRYRFGIRHRMNMLVSMNFPVYLLIALVTAIFRPDYLAGFSAIFWAAALFLYLFVPWIPGRSGWAQALVCAVVTVAAWAALDRHLLGDPLAHRGWFVATFLIFILAGFDLAGIATARTSDPEHLLQRIGIKSMGSFMSEKQTGRITLDREKCNGCRECFEVCPLGVYAGPGEDKKIAFRDREACFECGACVRQCPEHALSLE